MKTSLPLSFARLLKMLIEGELNNADFSSSNKKLLSRFVDDGVLDYRVVGTQQKKIFCPDKENLVRYLHLKFEISSLDGYIYLLEKGEFDRSDAVLASSDSKLRKFNIFNGFLLNSYEDLSCKLNDQSFPLKIISGAYTFLTDYSRFSIPADVTVVIVENYQNFRDIHRQRYLFEGVRALFIWRYQNSNALADWLNRIPNTYIHFGDFDPKGIHIYLSEFSGKILGSRGSFFVPYNIESLLVTYGSRSLYYDQEQFIPIIRECSDPQLKEVIHLICKYKKGLSQEVLIR